MMTFLNLFAHLLALPFRRRARLEVEIVMLWYQLNAPRRCIRQKPQLTMGDGIRFVRLGRLFRRR